MVSLPYSEVLLYNRITAQQPRLPQEHQVTRVMLGSPLAGEVNMLCLQFPTLSAASGDCVSGP